MPRMLPRRLRLLRQARLVLLEQWLVFKLGLD
jgi:hypothetical protein